MGGACSATTAESHERRTGLPTDAGSESLQAEHRASRAAADSERILHEASCASVQHWMTDCVSDDSADLPPVPERYVNWSGPEETLS